MAKFGDSFCQTLKQTVFLVLIVSSILVCIAEMYQIGSFTKGIGEGLSIIISALFLIFVTSYADLAKDKQGRYLVYKDIGDMYFQSTRYYKAIESYVVFIQLLRMSNEKAIETDLCLYNMKLGDAYVAINQLDLALEAYRKAEKYNYVHPVRGMEYYLKGKIKNILSTTKKGVKKSKTDAISNIDSLGYSSWYSNSAARLGESYFNESNLDSVISSKRIQAEKDTLNSAIIYGELARMFYQKDELDSSIFYFKKSIAQSVKINNKAVQAKGEQGLSEIYEEEGDYELALFHNNRYLQLLDAISQEREKEIVAQQKMKNSLNNVQQRIQLLEKNKEINEKNIELLRQQEASSQQSYQFQLYMTIALAVLAVSLIVAYYYMYKSNKQRKIANQLLALKSLRTQMNPHFIFNALNSVNAFISERDERSANKYLSEFSRLMRAVLENSKHDFVSLESELDIIKRYLSLEHFRFKDKFDYKLEIPEDLDESEIEIPPMLVQPYIENAVWHGLRYLEDKGELVVKFEENEEFLLCTVIDNGIGRTKSKELKTKHQKEHKSTGLKNTDMRLNILNEIQGLDLSIKMSDLKADGTGTKVEIKIPKNNTL